MVDKDAKGLEPATVEDVAAIKLVNLDNWDELTKAQEYSGTLTAKSQHMPMDEPTRLTRCTVIAFNNELKNGWQFLGQMTLYGVYTLVFKKQGEKPPTEDDLLKVKEEKKKK
jgi:hypothetical protein